jgi:hypothetical protein
MGRNKNSSKQIRTTKENLRNDIFWCYKIYFDPAGSDGWRWDRHQDYLAQVQLELHQKINEDLAKLYLNYFNKQDIKEYSTSNNYGFLVVNNFSGAGYFLTKVEKQFIQSK